MANIAILNYCNLQCPYCFANKFITEEEKQLITMEQLENILNFLSRSKLNRVALIGGEPTIHPQFSQILERVIKFTQERKIRCTVFSNGIKLGEYARLFLKSGCLINLNHPEIIGEAKWNELERSLKKLKACGSMQNMNFGINLYPDMIDYDYIFDLAKSYGKDSIRCSYVAPTCEYQNVDKKQYYTEAKDLFIPFVNKAKSLGIRVRLDCNNIPMCYFTPEELAEINDNIEGWKTFCNPVVDISPDMKGTACFGAYNLVDLNQFNNLEEAERYFMLKEMYPRAQNNTSGGCISCDKFKNLSCQGGCLAFSNLIK